MSILPIDMQGMVRNTTQQSYNSHGANTHANVAASQAFQKNLEEKATNLTQKAEKPAEERKELDKDGHNRQEFEQRRQNRQKREEEAEKERHKKLNKGMFDISI